VKSVLVHAVRLFPSLHPHLISIRIFFSFHLPISPLDVHVHFGIRIPYPRVLPSYLFLRGQFHDNIYTTITFTKGLML
jgi:hypothetical protein